MDVQPMTAQDVKALARNLEGGSFCRMVDAELAAWRLMARIAALERQVSSEWRCKEVYRKDVERLEAKIDRLREGMVRLAEEWDYLELQTTNVARFKAFAEGEKP